MLGLFCFFMGFFGCFFCILYFVVVFYFVVILIVASTGTEMRTPLASILATALSRLVLNTARI